MFSKIRSLNQAHAEEGLPLGIEVKASIERNRRGHLVSHTWAISASVIQEGATRSVPVATSCGSCRFTDLFDHARVERRVWKYSCRPAPVQRVRQGMLLRLRAFTKRVISQSFFASPRSTASRPDFVSRADSILIRCSPSQGEIQAFNKNHPARDSSAG